MSSNNIYRNNAEDCLRMAQTVVNDGDRPFWLTLAQSWLRLAERAARGRSKTDTQSPPVGSENR
jgi:hypothetical protein